MEFENDHTEPPTFDEVGVIEKDVYKRRIWELWLRKPLLPALITVPGSDATKRLIKPDTGPLPR